MISYFCTVGKGLEDFCELELSKIKDLQIHEVITGKVFFSCKEPPRVLLSLKTIERLFILVFNHKQILFRISSKQALHKLKATVESKSVDWKICLKHWLTYQKVSDVDLGSDFRIEVGGSKVISACVAKKQRVSYSENCDGSKSISSIPVRFRVSCKCSGNFRKIFHPQLLAKVIGRSLVKTQAWTVDLRNPSLEIYVHAGDEYLTVGLPVTKRPLSDRPYLKHIKVRSTLCHAILMAVGGIDSADVILDPMCGAATLLVEGAVSFPSATFIGLDISAAQLEKAKENVISAAVGDRVHLLHGNAVALPLNDGSVSRVICDVPFGNKFGSVNQVKRLLPVFLCSLNRVLCKGGKLTFLISDTLINFMRNSVHNLNISLLENITASCIGDNLNVCQWKSLESHSVKLGELPATICVYEKVVKCD